jgi:caa(3)-type oxidase subunit IV
MANHPSKWHYIKIFLILTALTAIEVVVATLKIAKTPMVIALVGLALTKALMVGWYFMHLKSDTKTMKLTVGIPFMFPALYAFVLIAEAAWRRLY